MSGRSSASKIGSGHLAAVIASREPEGYLETGLTVRIAEILWRPRRVAHYEADKISVALYQMPEDFAAAARYGAAVTGRPIEESMTLGFKNLPLPSVNVDSHVRC